MTAYRDMINAPSPNRYDVTRKIMSINYTGRKVRPKIIIHDIVMTGICRSDKNTDANNERAGSSPSGRLNVKRVSNVAKYATESE